MSQAPAMPLWTDALIGDTTHLSAEEFGAYLLILIATWRNNGQPFANDDTRLARICRVTVARFRERLRPILVSFFNLSDGSWRQKRLEKEWKYVAELSAVQSKKGKLSGEARRLKRNETDRTAVASGLEPEGQPNANPQTHTLEVSKEAGSKTETLPESTEPSNTAQAPLYAFVGKIIRLTGKDLTQWQATYHGIPDIIAKLRTLDAFYDENLTGTDRKKWFIRCASALDKAHQEALREARGASPPPPRHDAGDLSDEQLRELRAKREKANQESAARLAAEIAQSQAIWERDHRHTERGVQ